MHTAPAYLKTQILHCLHSTTIQRYILLYVDECGFIFNQTTPFPFPFSYQYRFFFFIIIITIIIIIITIFCSYFFCIDFFVRVCVCVAALVEQSRCCVFFLVCLFFSLNRNAVFLIASVVLPTLLLNLLFL